MKPRSIVSALLVVVALSAPRAADAPAPAPAQGRVVDALPSILPHRERVAAVNRMLRERLDALLPRLMRECGIDLWLVINREHNEDPVYPTLVPAPSFAARRLSMLVFHDRGPESGVERLTVSRYPLGDLYDAAWEGGSPDEQWQALVALLRERDPRRIGIDVSRDWPFADGLSASLRDRLFEELPEALRERVVSAEELCVRWLETRVPSELAFYPQAVAIARAVIGEAFSNRVITPGVTRPDDVAWSIRERFEQLELDPWFQPYVNVQRSGGTRDPEASFYGTSDGVILPGDVLHTDVGICYLRLCTDTQEMGYVLRPGESEVPEGLRRALAAGNRWQDLLTERFRTGRTGNEVLAEARAAAEAEGLVASIYSHPLGFHGHGAGPTIGMWDEQGPTPVLGDWPIRADTAYAIEGNVKVEVPGFTGGPVQIKLEQSAWFDGERVIYLAGRQTEWHVIR